MHFDEAISASPRTAPAVQQALIAAAQGTPVVLARRNHCLLTVVAGRASAQAVATLVRRGTGLIFAAAPAERLVSLAVPRMATNGARMSDQCVAIDAANGIGTGISANDRARTLRSLADPHADPSWFVRPGHVLPVAVGPNPAGIVNDASAALAVAMLCGEAEPCAGYCAVTSEANMCELADAAEGRALAEALNLPFIAESDLITALYVDSAQFTVTADTRP